MHKRGTLPWWVSAVQQSGWKGRRDWCLRLRPLSGSYSGFDEELKAEGLERYYAAKAFPPLCNWTVEQQVEFERMAATTRWPELPEEWRAAIHEAEDALREQVVAAGTYEAWIGLNNQLSRRWQWQQTEVQALRERVADLEARLDTLDSDP